METAGQQGEKEFNQMETLLILFPIVDLESFTLLLLHISFHYGKTTAISLTFSECIFIACFIVCGLSE
jgi:hypothetical protein